MKTNNVILRPMGQFQVQQRTKDGMFNATAVLKQWNEFVENLNEGNSLHLDTQNSGNVNPQKNGVYKKKDLEDYFNKKSTQEFLKALIESENLKERNSVVLTSRGKNGGTWMHPFLFIDFAMWLNPYFKVKVIKFVYDQMIKYRNEAGDAYKELSAAIYNIVDKSQMPSRMAEVSKGINYVVFGEHRNMIRNDKGTEQDQRKLYEMERKVAALINDGFLKDHGQVMNYLRKKYQERTTPAVFVR